MARTEARPKLARIGRITLALSFCCLTALTSIQSAPPVSASMATSETGILLMAHGGSKDWNRQVQDVADEVNRKIPCEIAFGMADRSALQQGIDKLALRGVRKIVAVPLFVSSHSSVIESTKYLLGLRPDAPKELADYATMNDHEMAGRNASAPSSDSKEAPHPARTESQPLPKAVQSSLPLFMTPALDRHPIVAQILSDRAASIAKDASRDVLILVAHGPNDEKENIEWLADMQALARQIAAHSSYARIECVTLRDDAESTMRDQATAELRRDAQTANDAGYHVLVVPLLLSYGGIENGLRKRLDGVEHVLSPQALLPDPRVAQMGAGERTRGAVPLIRKPCADVSCGERVRPRSRVRLRHHPLDHWTGQRCPYGRVAATDGTVSLGPSTRKTSGAARRPKPIDVRMMNRNSVALPPISAHFFLQCKLQ
jgi:sirohydrochlorin ferrochelatase